MKVHVIWLSTYEDRRLWILTLIDTQPMHTPHLPSFTNRIEKAKSLKNEKDFRAPHRKHVITDTLTSTS